MEWKSPFCGVTAPGTRVVQSAEDWKKLWAEIGRPAPDVELAGKAAVAVFLGERPTGGFGVSFLEPVPEKKVLRVRYKISTPKGMMVIQALTQPYGVKLLPGTTLEIKVEEAR